jgi:hypothetical protein
VFDERGAARIIFLPFRLIILSGLIVMKFSELMPALHQLPQADKFRALQFLTTELAQEEGANLLPGVVYPIWTPHDATDAAATLASYLREQTDGN